jgi:hypothetical protein
MQMMPGVDPMGGMMNFNPYGQQYNFMGYQNQF